MGAKEEALNVEEATIARFIINRAWIEVTEHAGLDVWDPSTPDPPLASTLLESRPTTVYHYCSAATATAILESKDLHLSASAHLNDPSEGLFGIDLLRSMSLQSDYFYHGDALQEFTDIRIVPSEEDASNLIATFNASFARSPYCYVLCFSAPEVFEWHARDTLGCDSLPLWRLYAAEASGVALGFSSHAVIAATHKDARLSFLPIVYNGQFQKVFLHTVLMQLCAVCQGDKHFAGIISTRTDSDISFARVDVQRIAALSLNAAVHLLKHPSYAYEQEWRLLHIGAIPRSYSNEHEWEGDRAYRPLSRTLTSGVPLQELGINSVTFGPCASEKARNLLLGANMDVLRELNISAAQSLIPFRGQ